MKAMKKALALLLCFVMTIGIFSVANITFEDLAGLFSIKAEAYTNTTIGRITQQQVVGTTTSMDGILARDFWYRVHSNGYFNGHSEPTNMVIPGLGDGDDYTPQGMTYWPEKNWVLMSAYDASGQGRASCIYAIDVASGKFVALFNIYNANGSVNTSHGGGIAASKHNFYYADSGSKISYIPLSELDVAENTEKNITIKGSVDFAGEMNSANTSYCCYDDGVLWVGNFYYSGDSRYTTSANAAHKSMLLGYRLDGDSSAEEWNYLCGKYKNRVSISTASGTGSISGANLTWNAYKNGDSVDVTGTITAPTAYVGEFNPTFASVELTEGVSYVIEFKTNYKDSDLYIFSPGGKHTNVKQSSDTIKTQLPDGRWHYKMTFTAGKKPAGADSLWPETQSTDGTYTGTYTMRFDQDAIQAGESRNFAMTDIGIREANTYSNNEYDYDRIHYVGTAGNPTYVVAFPDTIVTGLKYNDEKDIGTTVDFDKIQYAMVDNGRIYVSRSWSRIIESTNYLSELDIIDIDLNVPGTYSLTVNGATRNDCYLVTDNQIHQFHNLSMGEAVCVIDDYLYMFTESAAYNYRKKDWDTNKDSNNGPTNVATQPIDVVWKIDQYAIMGETRKSFSSSSAGNSTTGHVDTYVKINSLDEINYNDKYIIVYESDIKAANGNKILYALDSFGGYKAGHVPKNSNGTQANTADSLGIVGHPISKYATDGNNLKLNDVVADDKDSLHWNLIGVDTGVFRMQNNDSYYGKYKNLYFGSRLIYMMDSDYVKNSNGTITSKLDNMKIKDNGDGTFSFYYQGSADYYLWCNDGSIPAYTQAYNKIYNNTYAFGGDSPETTDVESGGVKAYAGQYEEPGTFHSDAFANHTANNSGNKTGEAVNEKYTKFHIYRRDEDTSIAGENGLATDLNAELKDDGTYTITLESYSTGQTITQKSTTGKPIDFVFVLDTSASMKNNSDVPYWGISDNPEAYDYEWADESRTIKYDGDSYYSTWKKRSDDQDSGWFTAWYKHTINFYSEQNPQDYYFGINSELHAQGSSSQNSMCVTYGFKKNPDKGFAGGFYWTNRTGDATRFEAMKQSTLDFIHQIQEHAQKTGLQHRIAIVQYGSTSSMDTDQYSDEGYYNTGMYSTVNGVSMVNYGTLESEFWYKLDYSGKTANGTSTRGTNSNGYGYDRDNATYENAFFPASHDNLKQIINNLSITADSDTFVDHGMTMAWNTIADQMTACNADADRVYGTYSKSGTDYGLTEADVNSKAVVINITDGAPGYASNDGDAAYMSAKGAIDMANTMKAFDVEIYNVQIGTATTASFSNTDFLDALSSNYIGGSVTSKYETTANSLTKGTSNGSGYYIQHNLANMLELDSLFDQISQAGENELLEVETVTLNSSSVTLQSLGDTFMLTDDSDATAKTSQIYYDSLGRIYEEEPVLAGYDVTKNVTNNTVQLTGFDYSSEYIAAGNKGKKLILQIDGVLLNPSKEHGLSLPISNEEKTAIYANSSAVTNGTATQYFPQVYFEVPTYSYVYDYGLTMVNSSIYGTPLSFDTVPDKQSTYSASVNIDGDAAISYNGTNVVSNIAPDCDGIRESFVLVKKPTNNGYYWAKVNMIPASNVYFEENYMGTVASANKDWSSTGTNAGLTQAISSSSDVYGYDKAYGANNTYSNGTAKTVTLDSTNKRSDTQTFNYTGTGFDIISACGTDTGMLTVTVKQNGTAKKVYIVDTFYNDTTYGTLNQVPVVHHESAYGTYTVETTAVYMKSAGAVNHGTVSSQAVGDTELETQSAPVDEITAAELLAQVGMEDLANADVELVWMDDDSILNGGAGADGEVLSTQAGETTSVSLVNYIDGFRIYNPLPAASQSAYASNESNANYYNVINSLASRSDIVSGNGATSFIGYVEKILGGSINFSDYAKSNAPKNEVYLTNNGESALTFKVKLNNSSSRVMLGMRAAKGTPTVVINGATITANGSNISSSTEMYYDITEAIKNNIADGYATITIKNTAESSLLAVNNVKIVDGSVAALASDDILEVASLMTMAVTRTIDVNSTAPVDYSVVYPGHAPNNTILNPDPDLDPIGKFVITTPETVEQQQKTQSIIEKLSELFNSLLSKIISFIKSVFSMIPFFKEV